VANRFLLIALLAASMSSSGSEAVAQPSDAAGPTGRFQIVVAPWKIGPSNDDLAVFLLDTVNGRVWERVMRCDDSQCQRRRFLFVPAQFDTAPWSNQPR